MHTYMVLFPVNSFDRHEQPERFEAQTYNDLEAFKGALKDDLGHSTFGDLRVYRLTDFMEMCNDEEINLCDFWVSYIYTKED